MLRKINDKRNPYLLMFLKAFQEKLAHLLSARRMFRF